MSYILDALKKAEAERRTGAHTGPLAALPVANAIAQGERKTVMRTPWPWVAMTAIAAALAAYSWLRPAPSVVPVAASQPQIPAPVSPPAAQPASPAELAQHQAPAAAQQATPSSLPAVVEEQPAPSRPRSTKPARPAEKKHASAEAKAAESEAPLPPTLRELPDKLQREIPQLSVNGYIYSGSKADRSVIINGRLLHEGEEAAPGLTLEKMMPNGMVLNYRGHRYRTGY